MDSQMTEGIRRAEHVILQRLDHVERENRRLKRLSHLLLAGLAILLGLTTSLLVVFARQSMATADVVQARRFVLRDENGLIRAVLGMQPDGSSRFALQDRDGLPRLQLTLLSDGSPGVALKDREGHNRAVLALPPDDMAHVVFADRQGNNRASLGLGADGVSSLILADSNGEPRAFLAVAPDGTPDLMLYERVREAGAPSPADTSASGGARDGATGPGASSPR
ncbi:MAG TPA: hypothetical protein VF192_09935 [Longimicrobiales bacterium]